MARALGAGRRSRARRRRRSDETLTLTLPNPNPNPNPHPSRARRRRRSDDEHARLWSFYHIATDLARRRPTYLRDADVLSSARSCAPLCLFSWTWSSLSKVEYHNSAGREASGESCETKQIHRSTVRKRRSSPNSQSRQHRQHSAGSGAALLVRHYYYGPLLPRCVTSAPGVPVISAPASQRAIWHSPDPA